MVAVAAGGRGRRAIVVGNGRGQRAIVVGNGRGGRAIVVGNGRGGWVARSIVSVVTAAVGAPASTGAASTEVGRDEAGRERVVEAGIVVSTGASSSSGTSRTPSSKKGRRSGARRMECRWKVAEGMMGGGDVVTVLESRQTETDLKIVCPSKNPQGRHREHHKRTYRRRPRTSRG